ncbi:DUF3783 domain-containing protein [Clostridium ihumii]|uniref:DUF3783 domain-containing protein n=1 Tax=Clostridium ihumii TaxID=1470356 RepID=UPI003D34EABB
MSNLNDKVIITYGLDESELEILNLKFKDKTSRECIVVKENMSKLKLRDILSENIEADEIHEMPKEKVIIFNNFSSGAIQSAVKIVRNNLESKPILASVTPVSINWSFKFLLEHLIKEREQFSKK